MKLKFLLVSTVIWISGCTKSVLHPFQPRQVNETMMSAVYKVCKQNGGIKSLELKKDGNAYFFCKKQGFLEVDQTGEIKTVKGKEPDTTEINSALVDQCVSSCGDGEIKTIQSYSCVCKNGNEIKQK